MTITPGIHDGIPADTYHADPAGRPSLSASLAHILVTQSPAHARIAHPKLNPALEREESDRFDLGTACHALLLQGDQIAISCPYPDWRTKEAREQRDQLRAEGRIALLADQYDRAQAMVAAARAQIAAHNAEPPLFTDGKPEQTIVWTDDHGVLCRARLDWLHDDHTAADDLKTTSASADPAKWTRTMYGIGADLQVAMYVRGVERLTGVTPVFRYVVIETYPPYALSVVDLAPSALALAADKVQTAIDRWAVCLEEDAWPGYASRVASIELPTWEEVRWLEREAMEAA